jgi:hypothetical protein
MVTSNGTTNQGDGGHWTASCIVAEDLIIVTVLTTEQERVKGRDTHEAVRHEAPVTEPIDDGGAVPTPWAGSPRRPRGRRSTNAPGPRGRASRSASCNARSSPCSSTSRSRSRARAAIPAQGAGFPPRFAAARRGSCAPVAGGEAEGLGASTDRLAPIGSRGPGRGRGRKMLLRSGPAAPARAQPRRPVSRSSRTVEAEGRCAGGCPEAG